MMRATTMGLVVLVLSAAACDKPSSGGAAPVASPAMQATSPAPTSAPSGSASAASSATPPATSAAASGSATTGGGTYAGSFKSKVAQVTTPKDAHIKVWGNDPGTDMLGDGSLTLSIAGAGERRSVTGEAKGVFGELVVAGELDGKTLQARVDPKNPNAANAMTGVLQGTLEGSTITGTLRVASRNANVVREADVKLSPAP